MHHSSKQIYSGRVIRLQLEQVTLPNGQSAELEVVHHPGGVAVLALDDRERICLLRQYRHVVGDWLWEIPAGKREQNELPEDTAHRELLEEAGFRAKVLKPLGHVVSSPGVFTEVVHLFMATGLQSGNIEHEAEEVIEVHWLPFDKVCHMIKSGEIYDGKTVSAFCFLLLDQDRQRLNQ